MRWLFRVLRWIVIGVLVLFLILLSPVAYVEIACRPTVSTDDYRPVLSEPYRRAESRTLLTYPEWHIVHAYDDYARVIETGEPHEFEYLASISGFWSSLCTLSETSGNHGGITWETKQMVYTIGVSFSAELLAKAAYEESIGHLAVWIRGENRSALDDLSAQQARDYAEFLQQIPWYEWDFGQSAQELSAATKGSLRDRERNFALGTEYAVKNAYAQAIRQAVARIGEDELTLRMIVTGITAEQLAPFGDVRIIAERPQGIEIETPRYRALTHIMDEMAFAGADFVEIAGNDEILVTAISGQPSSSIALISMSRQGYDDWRHLILLKVREIGTLLRGMSQKDLKLEHIHDY